MTAAETEIDEEETAGRRLTDNQLARAVSANLRWRDDLRTRWPTDAQLEAVEVPPLKGAGDFEFAEAIATYQGVVGARSTCPQLVPSHTAAKPRIRPGVEKC